MFRSLPLVGAALAVVGFVASPAPAHAAVPGEAAGEFFDVTCPTGRHALITLPVPGSFAPGIIAGADTVLVPYRFDYRWAEADGTVLIRSQAEGEPGPMPADAVTCRFAPTEYPDGMFLSFTVTGVMR